MAAVPGSQTFLAFFPPSLQPQVGLPISVDFADIGSSQPLNVEKIFIELLGPSMPRLLALRTQAAPQTLNIPLKFKQTVKIP